jgi:hypothetical protein
VIAGVSLQTVQTTLAAFAWLTILRAAFPRARITFRLVLASYAVSVAMNSFLPANIGTFVMLVMFTTVIAGATFAAIFSGAGHELLRGGKGKEPGAQGTAAYSGLAIDHLTTP